MLLRRHRKEDDLVVEVAVSSSLEAMTVEELTAYAEEKGIDIGQSTSQKGILKKILEAEKE